MERKVSDSSLHPFENINDPDHPLESAPPAVGIEQLVQQIHETADKLLRYERTLHD